MDSPCPVKRPFFRRRLVSSKPSTSIGITTLVTASALAFQVFQPPEYRIGARYNEQLRSAAEQTAVQAFCPFSLPSSKTDPQIVKPAALPQNPFTKLSSAKDPALNIAQTKSSPTSLSSDKTDSQTIKSAAIAEEPSERLSSAKEPALNVDKREWSPSFLLVDDTDSEIVTPIVEPKKPSKLRVLLKKLMPDRFIKKLGESSIVGNIVKRLADQPNLTKQDIEAQFKIMDEAFQKHPKAFYKFNDKDDLLLLYRNDLFRRLRQSPQGLGFIITLLLTTLKQHH